MWPVPAASATPVADVVSSSPDFFCKDGRHIRVGDCALFKPPQDSPPFIGIIRRLTSDKGNLLSLGVNWLYRPADLKLGKGIVLEAAPNEVFYSFHKDETLAASLLHPCKVAFLRKGVELPSGISSFVCRRVYDIENKCLWWLTDKDYINERQEEVDQLLDKTRQEMHGAVLSGGHSPKPLNNQTSASQLKPSSDSVQNSATCFSSQVKVKRKERGDQGSDPIKKERLFNTEDGESDQSRSENMLKSEIAKITEKGGLFDFEGVEKLVQLMQLSNAEKKIDLAGRIILVEVIAVTDRFDCLGWFVQLRGLPVLDEWLQEAHKGKIGDCNCPKEGDISVEEFLLALLRALDKLPVNLHALQTCNVGKSVNHLRTHKNFEIQKKARGLVDTWKRRVEAEMNINDTKPGSNRGVSWPTKPVPSEASHAGNKKTGGYIEVGTKSSTSPPFASKNPQVKLSTGDSVAKSSSSPGSTKSSTISAGVMPKDPNFRMYVGSGTSDLPLTPIKEERSSSSSQSQNNSQSCSSDHAKAVGSSCREDARSSTAGSVSVNKSSSGASRHRKSSNCLLASAVSGVQKESASGKVLTSNRNSTSEKASPSGLLHEKLPDVPLDHGNSQRLIVRLPTTGRSPARSATGVGTFEDPASAERPDHHDKNVKGKSDAFSADEGIALPTCDEGNVDDEGDERLLELSKAAGSSLQNMPRFDKYEASLISINALIESCAKFSEASASASPGDEVGMNLLASVAAGEISKSDNVSTLGSPWRNSPVPEELSSGNDAKSVHVGEEIAQNHCEPYDGASSGATADQGVTVDSLRAKNDSRHPATPDFSGDSKVISFGNEEKRGECTVQLSTSSSNQKHNADGPCLRSDREPSEQIHDASAALFIGHTKKGGVPEAEGHIHEQGKSGVHRARSSSIPDSKSNVRSLLLNEYKRPDNVNERTVENNVPAVSEVATTNAKVENEVNKESPSSPLEMGGGNNNTVDKEPSSGFMTKQKPALRAEILLESIKGKREDALPHSVSANVLAVEFKAEKTDDMKTRGHVEPIDRQGMDMGTSIPDRNGKYGEGIERKDALGHCLGTSVTHADLPTMPVCKNEQCEKSNGCKGDGVESGDTERWHASGVNAPLSAAVPDMAVKLDFDLNEGFPVDDWSQGEPDKMSVPVSSTVHLPCPLPFPVSSMSGSFPASITVAAAAKGPFVPPESPLRSKGELGWKGSAATSAFRPAEPRKILEMHINTSDVPSDTTSSKQGRPPLDIDLNVPDQRVYNDVTSQSSAQMTCSESGPRDRVGGLDLDLNRLDENPDIGLFSATNSCRLEIPFPSRSSLSSGLINGGINVSRDFDLNNGPVLDEVGSTEIVPRSQYIRSSIPFTSPIPGIRMNSAELGNISSWFHPGSSYSPIPVPSIFPGRGEQSYVAAAGSNRILGPTGSTSFGTEIYRGPVLSSSPAVAFSPATPFQYPGFPFETSFPLSSNSFSGCSTAYMDSSAGGTLCFPTIPSQLVGPAGVVSSPYSRPYIMNLPGSTSNVGPEIRKWGGQGLDLNAGPGSTDTERRDERLPTSLRQLSIPGSQALAEEQLKMFQVSGGVLKRKEPGSGWDPADRFSYRQHSWQ